MSDLSTRAIARQERRMTADLGDQPAAPSPAIDLEAVWDRGYQAGVEANRKPRTGLPRSRRAPSPAIDRELRMLVANFIEDHDEGRLGNPDPIWCDGKCVGARNLRAALAEPAPTTNPLPTSTELVAPSPAIDRERLLTAFLACGWGEESANADAAAIAREYDRLAGAAGDETDQ